MGEIFSIGGGQITDDKVLPLLKKLVEASEKEQPRVCFLPTARNDYKKYIDHFHRKFGQKLGCKTTDIQLINKRPSDSQIKRKIRKSDIVYVSGGNTERMLKKWEKRNINKTLLESYDEGTILAGWSAGAICWFEKAHSDSDSYNGSDWNYKILEGMGIVENAIACPHYNKIERQASFHTMIRETDCEIGFGIEDLAAVYIKDDKLKIVSENGKVDLLKTRNGEIWKEKNITHLDHFIPIEEL